MKTSSVRLFLRGTALTGLILTAASLTLVAQDEKQLVIGHQPVYKVSRAAGPILVDGRMEEADWGDAEVQPFNYFYRGVKPAEKQQTIFIRGYNPVYKVEVTYDGTINNDSDRDRMWRMEFAIPFTAFSDFHFAYRPKAGVRWAFQAVRQDRNFVDDRFRSTSTLFPIYDIRKDVHQPSRFGLLEFTDD
ncbi:MAG: hypothetical protein WAV93_10940 [Bacteroidales bacterium]